MPRKQARFGQPAVYNATPPTLTDGDDSALNVNASGALLTAASGSGSTAQEVKITDGTNIANVKAVSSKNGVYVSSNSATGSAVPADAYYIGAVSPTSGNLTGLQTLEATANKTGTTVLAAGLMAQLDDTAPTAITENQFGNVRMNTVRALYHENGPYLYSRATGDTQVKASAGFIHSVSIAPLTATPTAGLLTIYDNTAESGTIIYSEWIFATTPGHSILLDVPTTTGIYVGFDATLANVQASVSYR